MTYTRSMYSMPPNKVGERGEDEFWQLKTKPAGAMAASCVVNKYWQDIHAFQEETFNEIMMIIQLQMDEVSLLIFLCFMHRTLGSLLNVKTEPTQKVWPLQALRLPQDRSGLYHRQRGHDCKGSCS
jgi:hypothetical protein